MAGKFLRVGDDKIILRGISYGPFRPNADGEPFPEPARLSLDLAHLHELGFDTVRLYDPPSDRLLSEAQRLGLKLIVGLTWTDHEDFFQKPQLRKQIVAQVQTQVSRLNDHPAVIAFIVGNEIEKTLVRWMGPRRVQHFLELLIASARRISPNKLFSYATYPSTEYLIPRNADFLAFNLYLERREDLAAYLQRLQHLAGNKPLLISEFGLDVATHGEVAQAETRIWFENECVAAAVAGTVWFSYTDEWFRGGEAVSAWQFGLVNQQRQERPAARISAPKTSLGEQPFISVIICTYNGSATLRPCLDSLQKLRYPHFEILVIDDGSSQDIASITADFPQVRLIRQTHAGLSAARNLGANEAHGDILAYTDDDCQADEDWLTHLATGFDRPEWVACGGPNIPPTPRNNVECIVAAAPGAPAHVMLNDAEAEHLPGCNLAIRKDALKAIDGFRSHYRVAGDDVDICWRLREHGGRLRFLPGAMVWHHRRRTFSAYLRQQRGYGLAEALLMKDHPQHFGPLGGARWRGAIYGDTSPIQELAEGSIFHGPQGHAMFQGIYQSGSRGWLDWFSGTLWVACAAVALSLGYQTLASAIFGLSIIAAIDLYRRLPQTPHPLKWQGHLALISLCWLQPFIRESARLQGMIRSGARPSWQPTLKQFFTPTRPHPRLIHLGEWTLWSEQGFNREVFLKNIHDQHPGRIHEGNGWQRVDLTITSTIGLPASILSVTEYHGQSRTLTRVRGLLRLHFLILLIFATMLWLHLLTGSILILSLLLFQRWLMKRRIQRAFKISHR